jgi:hypothetical protein
MPSAGVHPETLKADVFVGAIMPRISYVRVLLGRREHFGKEAL